MHNERSARCRNTDVDYEKCQNVRKDGDDESEVDEFREDLCPVRYRLKGIAAAAGNVDWDDTGTGVNSATSVFAYSDSNVSDPLMYSFFCARYAGPFTAAATGFISLISPILMVIIPKIGVSEWRVSACSVSCQAVLVGLSVRLLLLVIASCMLFLRSRQSTFPRVFVFRALFVFLLFVIMITFWLFYVFHVFGKWLVPTEELSDEDELLYDSVVEFATSFADVLVFVYYLAVAVIELRQLDVVFAVKVTRSPDGVTRSYSVGRLSIQRLALWCLQQYYTDFEVSCCLLSINQLVLFTHLQLDSQID